MFLASANSNVVTPVSGHYSELPLIWTPEMWSLLYSGHYRDFSSCDLTELICDAAQEKGS